MAEVTYHFNARGDAVWANPDNIVDNNLVTFGSTATDGAAQVLTGNSCPGTDLGTITKVELRLFGKGDGDDRIDITPIFSAGDGNMHPTTPVVLPGDWTPYVEITNDTNHPDWSLWSHIQVLDCKLGFTKVAKGNIAHCSKVEIRVTYTPYPSPPSSLASPSQTETAIDLTWTKGANSDKTLIRFRDDQYPTGTPDGYLAYFDTGESVTPQKQYSKIQELTSDLLSLYSGTRTRIAERVNAFPVANISRVSFKLYKTGFPTGMAYIRIRKVSDDSILATVGTKDVETLTTVPTWYDFGCDIDNPTKQDLRFSFEYDGGNLTNAPRIRYQHADVLAGAVFSFYIDLTWWDQGGDDVTIKIYYSTPLEPATTYYFRAWGYQSSTGLYSEETADLTQATSGAPPAYYHGLKVQGVGELALCDVGTHPLRIRKGGTTYGMELVDIEDPNASAIRIKTGAGIKAIRKYT